MAIEEMEPNKNPLKSKTLWAALILAVLGFFPSAKEWVAHNQDIFMWILAGVFGGLRLATKGKISIS